MINNRALPWIVCFCASLFFAYELVQMHMLNAISDMLLKELSLNAQQFGYLNATYLLADVLFLLPAGIILDRYSTRRVILTALFLCIAGTFGFMCSHSLFTASLCHFFSGIGNAFCFLSCMLLVARWFPKEKQASVTALMVTMGISGAFMAQSPFAKLAEELGWRGACGVVGLIGIGIFILIFLFVKDHPNYFQKAKKTENALPFWEGVIASLSNRQNICCGLFTGFMNLPLMLISAVWGSLFLKQVHHITGSEASYITSMISVGTIVGSPAFGYFSDKIRSKKLLMIFGAIASFCIINAILFANAPSKELLLALFFLLGLVTSAQVLGYPLITENNPPHLTGTSQGIAAVIIMGIAMAAQPLSGHLITLGWSGLVIDGNPIYSYSDFLRAFLILPAGFILSMFLAAFIYEPTKVATQA